jgi:hypothetical protein
MASPETSIYKRNRSVLWAYWSGGRGAIAGKVPPDCGAFKFIEFYEAGDPGAIREMARQCCGNPPQDLALDIPALPPGTTFVATLPGGQTVPAAAAGVPAKRGARSAKARRDT